MSATKELVLPSGVFARIRPILWGDLMLLMDKPSGVAQTILMAQCVTFDGQHKTVDEIGEMEAEEILPLLNTLNELLAKVTAAFGRKGIA